MKNKSAASNYRPRRNLDSCKSTNGSVDIIVLPRRKAAQRIVIGNLESCEKSLYQQGNCSIATDIRCSTNSTGTDTADDSFMLIHLPFEVIRTNLAGLRTVRVKGGAAQHSRMSSVQKMPRRIILLLILMNEVHYTSAAVECRRSLFPSMLLAPSGVNSAIPIPSSKATESSTICSRVAFRC